MSGRKFAAVAASLGVATWVAGCGKPGGPLPEVAKVHGKISYGGKPLSKGAISFVPADPKSTGQVATGPIGSDGTFDLTTFNTNDGALIGSHKVVVQVPQDATNYPPGVDPAQGKMPIFSGPNSFKPPKPPIPAKYTRAEDTPLKQTVVAGKPNEFDIELKD